MPGKLLPGVSAHARQAAARSECSCQASCCWPLPAAAEPSLQARRAIDRRAREAKEASAVAVLDGTAGREARRWRGLE